MDILTTILVFILTVSIIIVFHEFGHYIAARACGVKVLEFSLGFGKKIFSYSYGKDKTEYKVCALPLGGYVKMLGEEDNKFEEHEKHRAFQNQDLYKKFFIVFCGPLFNFILAIFFYFLIFTSGYQGIKPVISDVVQGSYAEQVDIRKDDLITYINSKEVNTWSEVIIKIMSSASNDEEIIFTVNRNGSLLNLTPIKNSRDLMKSENIFEEIGIVTHFSNSTYIGLVKDGSLAQKHGINAGHKIISINDKIVNTWNDVAGEISKNINKQIKIILYDGTLEKELFIPVDSIMENGEMKGKLGISPEIDSSQIEKNTIQIKHSVSDSLILSVKKTYDMTVMTVDFIFQMILGNVSAKNISGPVGIAKYASDSFSMGISTFLNLLAILSISIGILNLLPIPMLDGGHLAYYTAEFIMGKPVSPNIQLYLQQFGIAFIIFLTIFALYNDIARLM
ncbi:MAG: RIP metalloprotease RseP [Gammaproteobacteria bacterium]|nr:RIP metalloprotease RseP [Gammaproteobacteria bacterium]|tara:strand:- start:4583 stop:5932 length:1350 start_codon:yes stop_codon:yes gene_type:complete